MVPGVVQLGGEPDLFTRDTRVLDSQSDLCFIVVCEGTAERLLGLCSNKVISKGIVYVSIWRYPFKSACLTASLTSLGLDCHVPRPTAGILAPVLRVNVFLSIIVNPNIPVVFTPPIYWFDLLGVVESRHFDRREVVSSTRI